MIGVGDPVLAKRVSISREKGLDRRRTGLAVADMDDDLARRRCQRAYSSSIVPGGLEVQS
jgi:hypothetical protein